MARWARWTVTVVTAAVVFGVCLWGARSVSFELMADATEADRWAVAAAFAAVVATAVAAAVGWWAGREDRSGESVVSQRATASGRGRAVQVGRDQNASDTPGAGSVPGRVDQYAKVSDDASVTQVGRNQRTGSRDDEQPSRP